MTLKPHRVTPTPRVRVADLRVSKIEARRRLIESRVNSRVTDPCGPDCEATHEPGPPDPRVTGSGSEPARVTGSGSDPARVTGSGSEPARVTGSDLAKVFRAVTLLALASGVTRDQVASAMTLALRPEAPEPVTPAPGRTEEDLSVPGVPEDFVADVLELPGSYTRADVMEATGLSKPTCVARLARMVKAGLLVTEGTPARGFTYRAKEHGE